jgi:pimeloyl-ACP methyl ester carboxylesterase
MNPEPTAPALSNRYVDCAGARIYTEICGDGPPILLLHGWTLDHRSFAFQVPAFSRHMQVINIDRRGAGHSSGEPDLAAEIADIDRLIDTFSAGPIHLLGVSQGGRLALRYAAHRPERLYSLVLQGAELDGFEPQEDSAETIPLAEYAALARDGHMDQVRSRWLAHPMMSAGVSDPRHRAALKAMVDDYGGRDLVAATPVAPAPDVASRLQGSPLPTLIITGEYEVAARKRHAEHLLELLPNSAQVIMDGAGHLANVSHADRYNHLVIDFCRATAG